MYLYIYTYLYVYIYMCIYIYVYRVVSLLNPTKIPAHLYII
jgi:hypothetical protein